MFHVRKKERKKENKKERKTGEREIRITLPYCNIFMRKQNPLVSKPCRFSYARRQITLQS